MRVALWWLLVGGAGVACAPSTPAKFPDHDKVRSAQQGWCGMLAKLDDAEPKTWRHREDCEAGKPAASSAYLKRLTTCYARTVNEYGESAPDSGAMLDACSQEILGGAEPGDVSATKLFAARCDRQQRCQKVSRDICEGTWSRLDGRTRALLSSQFNLGAQAEIARCLDDTECVGGDGEAEAEAEAACYDGARDKLVWLPI